jgi:hypothetical protein
MRTITIEVEEHEALPDGCYMRFSAISDTQAVRRLDYETPSGEAAIVLVEGRDENDRPVPAWTALVDDSAAGQSMLVGGGAWGLRLRPEAGGEEWAEPYLLLSREAILEGANS